MAIIRGVVDERSGAVVRAVQLHGADRAARIVPGIIVGKTGDVHVAATRIDLIGRAGLAAELGLSEIGLQITLAGGPEAAITLADATDDELDSTALCGRDIELDDDVARSDDRRPQLRVRLVVLRIVRACDLPARGVIDVETRARRNVEARETDIQRSGLVGLDAIAPDADVAVLLPRADVVDAERSVVRDREAMRSSGGLSRGVGGGDRFEIQRRIRLDRDFRDRPPAAGKAPRLRPRRCCESKMCTCNKGQNDPEQSPYFHVSPQRNDGHR